jgi:FMN-dependent NADH-azoreductase
MSEIRSIGARKPSTSGGDYITGMSGGWTDMATPYLREMLSFIGVKGVRFVPIGPTNGPIERIEAARQGALRRIAEIADRF